VRSVPLLLMVLFSGSAWAQAVPEVESTALQALQERLSAAETAGVTQAQETQRLRTLLENGSKLVDPNRSVEDRIQAAQKLTDLRDSTTFPFLRAAARSERAALRRVLIELAPQWADKGAVDLLHERVLREFGEGATVRRELALNGLGAMKMDEAADALWDVSTSALLPRTIRDQSRALLLRDYAAYVQRRGGLPTEKSDLVGGGSAVLGSAITGGVLLSSVGTWGQSEAGAAVGGLGGAAIGAGTAALYLRSNTVPRGAGLRYASNVLWGVAGSGMAISALNPGDDEAALIRTAAVTTGAVTGYMRLKHQPSQANVLETNFGGIVGVHLGTSVPGMLQREPYTDKQWRNLEDQRTVGALLGATAGLGVSSLAQNAWTPDLEGGLFSGLMAVEGAILLGTVPIRHGLKNRQESAYGNTGFNLGLTGGLLLTHFVDVPVVTTQVAATGALIGHVAGDGVAKLNTKQYEETYIGSQIAVPAGLVGTVAGTLTAPLLAPTTADAATIGVGTFLSSIQSFSLTNYLREKKTLKGTQPEAITQLVGSGTALSLLALSPVLEVKPSHSLFLLSGAGWGAWYGALGQMVIPNKMTDAETVLLVTGTMDVGIGAAGILASQRVGLRPEDTFIPQLFGVAGGTVGALAVMLATESTRKIAGGALVGSTVGLGAGAIMGPKMKKSPQATLNRRSRTKKRSGQWSFIALPQFGEAGQVGGHVQIQGVGL